MSEFMCLIPNPPIFTKNVSTIPAPVVPPDPVEPFQLPMGYGLVTMVGVASTFVVLWKKSRLSAARKRYDLPDPVQHSGNHPLFNCASQAYSNIMEMHTSFLFLLLTGGLQKPFLSALGGIFWILGRLSLVPRMDFFGHCMIVYAAASFSINNFRR